MLPPSSASFEGSLGRPVLCFIASPQCGVGVCRFSLSVCSGEGLVLPFSAIQDPMIKLDLPPKQSFTSSWFHPAQSVNLHRLVPAQL